MERSAPLPRRALAASPRQPFPTQARGPWCAAFWGGTGAGSNWARDLHGRLRSVSVFRGPLVPSRLSDRRRPRTRKPHPAAPPAVADPRALRARPDRRLRCHRRTGRGRVHAVEVRPRMVGAGRGTGRGRAHRPGRGRERRPGRGPRHDRSGTADSLSCRTTQDPRCRIPGPFKRGGAGHDARARPEVGAPGPQPARTDALGRPVVVSRAQEDEPFPEDRPFPRGGRRGLAPGVAVGDVWPVPAPLRPMDSLLPSLPLELRETPLLPPLRIKGEEWGKGG